MASYSTSYERGYVRFTDTFTVTRSEVDSEYYQYTVSFSARVTVYDDLSYGGELRCSIRTAGTYEQTDESSVDIYFPYPLAPSASGETSVSVTFRQYKYIYPFVNVAVEFEPFSDWVPSVTHTPSIDWSKLGLAIPEQPVHPTVQINKVQTTPTTITFEARSSYALYDWAYRLDDDQQNTFFVRNLKTTDPGKHTIKNVTSEKHKLYISGIYNGKTCSASADADCEVPRITIQSALPYEKTKVKFIVRFDRPCKWYIVNSAALSEKPEYMSAINPSTDSLGNLLYYEGTYTLSVSNNISKFVVYAHRTDNENLYSTAECTVDMRLPEIKATLTPLSNTHSKLVFSSTLVGKWKLCFGENGETIATGSIDKVDQKVESTVKVAANTNGTYTLYVERTPDSYSCLYSSITLLSDNVGPEIEISNVSIVGTSVTFDATATCSGKDCPCYDWECTFSVGGVPEKSARIATNVTKGSPASAVSNIRIDGLRAGVPYTLSVSAKRAKNDVIGTAEYTGIECSGSMSIFKDDMYRKHWVYVYTSRCRADKAGRRSPTKWRLAVPYVYHNGKWQASNHIDK